MKLPLSNLSNTAFPPLEAQGASLPVMDKPELSFPAKPQKAVTSQRMVTRLTVGFDETRNSVHENKLLCKEDCRNLWYNDRDISSFRQQARSAATLLQTRTSFPSHDVEHQSWAQCMGNVYREYCNVKEEMVDIEQAQQHNGIAAPGATVISTLGLERRAIPSVSTDVRSRKYRLIDQIMHWQYSSLYRHDVELRSRMIEQVSRHYSLPCRLYARHVAAIVAADERASQ